LGECEAVKKELLIMIHFISRAENFCQVIDAELGVKVSAETLLQTRLSQIERLCGTAALGWEFPQAKS
jgi:hypothetical protein